jgi:branched-subunit amino acid transport protein
VVHSQSTAPTLITQFEPNGTLAERIALSDARVRQYVSYAIAAAFLVVKFLTLAGVVFIFETDNANIIAKVIAPEYRVINANVVMTVVGGTTVQLGALALTMGRYLYR